MQVGYATPDDVPQRVKLAMLMLVSHFWNNRDAVVAGQRAAAIEMPLGVTALLNRLRLITI